MTVTRLVGDSRDVLATLPEKHFHCCITSPPYFGLRNYGGGDREIGTEQVLDCMAWATDAERCNACYVCSILAVCEGVWWVLRDDGVFFLNIGDSYFHTTPSGPQGNTGQRASRTFTAAGAGGQQETACDTSILKPKDLCLVPSRLALALQAAGWYVRSDIIWSKPNPMPESVTDRPTKAHEYVLMLTKSPTYYYDHIAVREPSVRPGETQVIGGSKALKDTIGEGDPRFRNGSEQWGRSITCGDFRNRRSVWEINTRPCSEAHFAVMPPKLVEPCLLSSTSAGGCCSACGAPWKRVTKITRAERDDNGRTKSKAEQRMGKTPPPERGWESETETLGWEPTCKCADAAVQPCRVLDPFGGSGTVALVAAEHGRDCTLIDLVPHNMEIIAVNRLKRVQPRLALEA